MKRTDYLLVVFVWISLVVLTASTFGAPKAVFSLPEKAVPNTIIKIDTSGSVGELSLFIFPKLPPAAIILDSSGRVFYVTFSKLEDHVVTLIASKDGVRASACGVIRALSTPNPIPSPESALTKFSNECLPPEATDADRTMKADWFMDFGAMVVGDNLLSGKITPLLLEEVKTWSPEWKAWYNKIAPAINKIQPITPEQWAAAFEDVEKGIRP